MENFKYMKDEIIISIILLAVTVGLISSCTEPLTPEQEKASKEYYDKGCYSKKSGSSPRCWTPEDWAAYCSHTNACK